MDNQQELSEILRKKGIGPSGSKCLKTEDLERLPLLFKDKTCSLTTKATLLTALLSLEPTEEEQKFLEELKAEPEKFLPSELLPFLGKGELNEFQTIINQVILGNDLNQKEASNAFRAFFDQPDYLKGAFLEAQRLKRETFEENSAFLNVLKEQVTPFRTDLPSLIDFGDSYDGNKRFPPLNLFVAAILGSLGYPCLLHGTDKVAPKEGVTHHAILKAAGKRTNLSLAEALEKLKTEKATWAYVDQSVFHPQMEALKQVRKDMVKRPFLATFEKMMQPIRAQKNYLLTQYTHTHYKNEIAKLVTTFSDFDKALHVKGMEGTSMINPTKAADCVLLTGAGMEDVSILGTDFGYSDSLERQQDFTAEDALKLGLRVLEGEDFPVRRFIQFQCVLILHYLFGVDKETAVYEVRQAIDSGSAKRSWDSF